MVDNSVLSGHTSVRISRLILENEQIYAVLALGAGSKLLPCAAADLVEAESIERRAREYFGAEYRLANEWNSAISSAMLQGVVG